MVSSPDVVDILFGICLSIEISDYGFLIEEALECCYSSEVSIRKRGLGNYNGNMCSVCIMCDYVDSHSVAHLKVCFFYSKCLFQRARTPVSHPAT